MADMQVADVQRLIDGLRWDRRRHPHRGRWEYSLRAQEVAARPMNLLRTAARSRYRIGVKPGQAVRIGHGELAEHQSPGLQENALHWPFHQARCYPQ
jgi:hypothetical protein